MVLEACGLFVLLAAGVARATPLAQEGFNYPLVSPIDGTQTGGVGFATSSNWGSTNASIVAGLVYPGLATSGTNALRVTAYGRHQRSLASSMGGSTFYFSMLINTYGTDDGRFGLEIPLNIGPCFGRVAGGWGFFAGVNGTLVSNTNGDFKTWVGVPSAADSLTHLIVFKLDYAANAIKLYVDPVPAVGEPPAPSATLVTGGAWTVMLNSQTWNGIGQFDNTGASETIDEIRIGTAWADVAPLSGIATTTDSWWTNVTTGAGASWGDTNNWVNAAGANVLPGPGHAYLTVAGASYTALYDSAQPAITNLTLQNTAPNRTALIVSAPLTSLGGAAIRLRSGASMTVTNGGVWNYVGTNAVTDKVESMLSISGGELNLRGGMIAFTNLPIASTTYGNYINVGYLSTGTLRVAAGRLEYYERVPRATTNNNRCLLIGYGAGGNGTLEVSGGSVLLGMEVSGVATLAVGNGSGTRGTVVVSGGEVVFTNAVGWNLLQVGYNYGVGTFIVTNTGYVNMSLGGGSARAYIGQAPSGNGTLRMDGGYMSVVDGTTIGYSAGDSSGNSPTGLLEVTAGTYAACASLTSGMGQQGTTPAVGSINIYGGQVTEYMYGVYIGRGRAVSGVGGVGIGRLTITNGLLNITGASTPADGVNDVHSGLAIGTIYHNDSNPNNRARGDATVSGSGIITNVGVLVIGVNGATGTLTQTGGKIVHAPGSAGRYTIIGYGSGTNTYFGGGNGTYTMSGGTYYTPNPVFIGGLPTNLQSYSRSGGVGLLKVSGGTFTATNTTLMVGGNGIGTLTISSNGVCFAKDIVLTNNTASTLHVDLGTSGPGTLTASGTLSIYSGAKLEVDSRAYKGSAVWVRLVDCATRTTSFDPANITVTGKGVVRQDRNEDIWLYYQRGTTLLVN